MWINIPDMDHLGYIFSMFWLSTIGATSQAPQASATSTLIGHKRRCSSFGTKLVHKFFFSGVWWQTPGGKSLGLYEKRNSLNSLLYSQRSRKKNDILWKSHLKHTRKQVMSCHGLHLLGYIISQVQTMEPKNSKIVKIKRNFQWICWIFPGKGTL